MKHVHSVCAWAIALLLFTCILQVNAQVTNCGLISDSTNAGQYAPNQVFFGLYASVSPGNTIRPVSWHISGTVDTVITNIYADLNLNLPGGNYSYYVVFVIDSNCVDTVYGNNFNVSSCYSAAGFTYQYLGGGNVKFTNTSSSTNGYTSAWLFYDNNTIIGSSNLTNPLFNFTGSGPYSAELIVNDSTGNCADTVRQVIVLGSCTATAGFTYQNAGGGLVQFTNNSVSTNGYTSNWIFDNVSGPIGSSGLKNPQFTYSGQPPYAAMLIVTDSVNGCADTITQFIGLYYTCVTLQTGTGRSASDVISSNSPNLNVGNSDQLFASQWTNTGSPVESRGLLQFNLSQIPVGSTIISAGLSLFADTNASNGYYGEPTYGTNNACYLEQVTSAWGQYAVTWNTQPSFTATNEVLLPQSTNYTENYVNLNVAGFVQSWVNNPSQNYGMLLKMITPNHYNSMIFCSSLYVDSSLWPSLDICYIPACNIHAASGYQNLGSGLIQFTNTSTGSVTNTTWVFGDGGVSYAANPEHQYLQNGTYTVSLFVNDSVTGCSGSDSIIIVVNNVPLNTDTLCGLVFNDANGNGVFDYGESVIPNAEVLIDGDPYYTDSTGFYHVIVGAGTHTISVVIPGGWQQTYPANPSYYTIVTYDSSDICGFDFGMLLQSSQGGDCFSFDNLAVPPGNQQQAFNIYGNGNPGFLQNWLVTNGTPNIETSGEIAGLDAYDGNQFAMIAACQDVTDLSEGVSLQYNFLPGQSYQVSMAIRNVSIVNGSPTPIDIKYILLQNPISYIYNSNVGCTATPAIPPGSLVVDSIIHFAQNSWSVVSFTISNLSTAYTQLWFRINFTNGPDQPSTALCFDSVCVQPIQPPVTTDCYSFDDSTVPPGYDQQQAFNVYGNGNPGFLQDWDVSSGTPSIEASGDIPGVDAYSGNQYALIAVCQDVIDYSEGVTLHHSFVPGQSYQVSMAIRNTSIVGGNPTPIDVNFILLQSPISYAYNDHVGCSPTPAIANGAITVHSITNYAQNSWSVISFTISNLTIPYTQLWFRVNFTNGPDRPSTAFCFDSVCIEPITADCYSFDDTAVPPANQQQAFNIYGNGHPGFLQDWLVTGGTPSIQTSGELANVNAYDGNQYALIAVCQDVTDNSEGVSLQHSFLPGQSYQVSMAILNTSIVGGAPTPIDINYILLQSPIAYAYNSNTGCSATPAVPTGALTVHTINNFAQNSWSVITFTISNLTIPYSQLWFRVNFTAGPDQPSTALCFDSVCIQPLPVTSDCYSFDDTTVPTANQQQAFNIYGNGHPGFLQDWDVTNGTPNVESSGEIAGLNAYDGNQFAMIAVCDNNTDNSEGVALNHNFIQGQSYQVSMAILNTSIIGGSPSPIDINYILLPSPIAYTYNSNLGCSATPVVPTSALPVYTISNFAQTSWSVISFTINNLANNYSQLWFRVNFSNGPSQPSTALCFDSVCITGLGSGTTAITDIRAAGDVPLLYQNDVNPFNGETTIPYYLPASTGSDAVLIIHDITGKLIKQYNLKRTGNGTVVFDAAELSAGVYLYSLLVDNVKIDTRRMLLVK